MHQRVLLIQRHAVQIENALGIHENLHVVEVEDLVGWPRLRVELELIAEAGASAAQHAQAQPTLDAMFVERSRIFATALGVTVTIA